MERPECPNGNQTQVIVYRYWQTSQNATGWSCSYGTNTAVTQSYTMEFDGSPGASYWCWRAAGTLLECRVLGWGSTASPATYLYAFGYSSHTSAQMGGHFTTSSVELKNIIRK